MLAGNLCSAEQSSSAEEGLTASVVVEGLGILTSSEKG